MFLNSDTSMAVLSAVPADPGSNPLEADEIRDTREIINSLAGSQRLLIHGLVLPDLGQAQLDGMDRLAGELAIGAWKVYTPYGGWRLDDPAIGIPFLDKVEALGIRVVCAHKGLPLPGFDPAFASPEDIGVVAAMYPQIKFVVYHSGYETSITEGPYNDANPEGIDRLIKAVVDSGATNIYAELGSTWRNVMTDPTESAHVIGKLLRYLGEDRVVWGTDSIWYGTPQDQITAFRALQIPMSMQDTYGYPALTPAVRAKVFGLSSAAIYGVDVAAVRCALDEDDIAQLKRGGAGGRQTFRGYGPATRREMFDFLRSRDGRPG
jgi:predicted TIM-barrel fold metal-dependent hydrolase